MSLPHEQACIQVFLAPKPSTLMSKYMRDIISCVYLDPTKQALMQLVSAAAKDSLQLNSHRPH